MISRIEYISDKCWNNPDYLRKILAKLNSVLEERDAVVQSFLPERGRRQRLEQDAKQLLAAYPESGATSGSNSDPVDRTSTGGEQHPASRVRPPLFGIPVGIKDLFHVAGFETRAGSELPPELFAGAEASVVTRLKQTGALIAGKTVATEFAFAEPGPTRNPHHLDHTPGGSSSGSAAAVAAGFVPLALGTQTIGSVARPASFCGVVGFKPSYGRLAADGCVPFSVSVDHVGFFAPDVASVAPVAAALIPEWNNNSGAVNTMPEGVGVVTGAYWEQCDECMRNHIEDQVARLVDRGVPVERVDLFPDWPDWVDLHYDLIAAEFAAFHAPWFDRYRELYRPRTIELIERGQTISAERVETARAGRLILRQRVMNEMRERGIGRWITPSAMGPAPEGLDSTGSPLMNLPWSYTGLPTLTVPGGRSEAGLPLGTQWVGPFGGDEWLVNADVD